MVGDLWGGVKWEEEVLVITMIAIVDGVIEAGVSPSVCPSCSGLI